MSSIETDAIEWTKNLVRLNTVNPPGNEDRCAHLLAPLLEKAGFEVQLLDFAPSRTNLIARIPGSADTLPLCLTGHLDTVPLGNADWSVDPYSADSAGDRLFGRGTTDMKAGIAAMSSAAIDFAQGRTPKRGLTLVFTAGEEICCQGASWLARQDGLLERAGALLVGEPTGNLPFLGHKGIMWLEAVAKGVSAHASLPHEGDNAIYKMAQACLNLSHLHLPGQHPHLGCSTLNVGTIQGGSNPNSVPDEARIKIDVRSVPGYSQDEIRLQILAALGPEIELKTLIAAEGVVTSEKDEWLHRVYDIVESITHQRPTHQAATYFTDASFLKPAMHQPPTLILGPGEVAMAHKTDEYCLMSRISMATEIYREVIESWCA